MKSKLHTILSLVLQKMSTKPGVAITTLLILCALTFSLPKAVTVSTSSGIGEIPIHSVMTENRQVSLTFNAAWDNSDINEILDTLTAFNLKATFFVTGEWCMNYPDDVRKIAAAGHDLGNLTSSYKNMSKLTAEECEQEIRDLHDTIKNLTDVDMTLFRPPYGDYNDQVITAAANQGYYSIQWSVDSMDWKDYGSDKIVHTVTGNETLENGGIVLLHCGTAYTKEALEPLIVELQSRHFDILPVSELIYTEGYSVDSEGKQVSGSFTGIH